jgi:antibiotic biosynthesis monooxygenase (ABM) superfamily enzyme
MRPKIIWAGAALVLLTIAGLVSLYQVLFDVWMTAYPLADANEWRTRLYIRLATAVVIAVLWSVLAIWLKRQGRRQAGGTR